MVHDSIDSNNLGQHQRTRGSAFVSLDVRALKRFSFSVGAREEYFATGPGGGQAVFSPSASAGYWLTTRLRLHGSVSHAFRLPSYTDLYYHDPGNVGYVRTETRKSLGLTKAAQTGTSRTTSAPPSTSSNSANAMSSTTFSLRPPASMSPPTSIS